MKKILYYIQVSLLGSLIWCILHEELSIGSVLVGLMAGFLAVVFADGFLMRKEHKRVYSMNPFVFVGFSFHAIFSIFKAGILVIPLIITGKTNVGIIRIRTDVDKGLTTSLIANAITLTPGTVTIDKWDNELLVLCIDLKTRDSVEAGRIIKGNMERILLKGKRR
ncbi:MAG: Na+/H+ antiporter subunit E [Clostridia bacterium]